MTAPQLPVSFRLAAHPSPGHNLIEVTSDFWSGFDTYRVEVSDDPGDRKDWRPLRGAAPTVLPPSGTAVWTDFDRPARGTRWYRARAARTGTVSSPVPVTQVTDPAQHRPRLPLARQQMEATGWCGGPCSGSSCCSPPSSAQAPPAA